MIELQNIQGDLFIKNFVLNPIFVNLTFQMKRKDGTFDQNFLMNLLTSTLGTALANLDNAPITLSGIQLDNVFDSSKSIQQKILKKYKNDAAKIMLKVVGSLDIVGNPIGLFNNISTGFKDLIEKPKQGFNKGPLDFGKGVVKGTGSLVKNTISGTMNSIGKMSGSLASGISALTMDDEYARQREKAKLKRVKGAKDGLYQGAATLGKGVIDGVTGIFTKPIEGASKGGVKGLFKGIYQGVTGAIVKPVTGVLDAASKTAEGFKTSATSGDAKASEDRVRDPRAFYGKERSFKIYNETDSELLKYLTAEKRDYSLYAAYEVFETETDPNDCYILGLCYESLVYYSLKKNRFIRDIDMKNIAKVNNFNDGIQIHLKNPIPDCKDKILVLKNCDPQMNEFIYKNLVEFLNQV